MDVFLKLDLNLIAGILLGVILYAANLHLLRCSAIGCLFRFAGMTVLLMLF